MLDDEESWVCHRSVDGARQAVISQSIQALSRRTTHYPSSRLYAVRPDAALSLQAAAQKGSGLPHIPKMIQEYMKVCLKHTSTFQQ
jgi:hypothetical protein